MIGHLNYLNWQLTPVSLATIPAMIYIARTVQRRAPRVGGRFWEAQMRPVGIVDDVSRGWRSFKRSRTGLTRPSAPTAAG